MSQGLEKILKDCNVIIGTLADVVNCRHLTNEKAFDCCIIDHCHLLSDVYVISFLHLGINCMIIAGDTDHKLTSDHTMFAQNQFNVSLFQRVFQKLL